MSRAGERGPERETDERLAAFVDDCMSERERDRFVAELRVNPQLKKDLDEYERTVEAVRRALQAPTVAVPVADRVMAQIAAQQLEAGNGPGAVVRPGRGRRLVVSVAAAAALLVLAVWLNSLPKDVSVGDPLRTADIAGVDPGAEAPPSEERGGIDKGGEREGVGALAEGMRQTFKDRAAKDRAAKDRGQADGERELLQVAAGEAELPETAAGEKPIAVMGKGNPDASLTVPLPAPGAPTAPASNAPAGDQTPTVTATTEPPGADRPAADKQQAGIRTAQVTKPTPKPKIDPDARASTGSDDFYLGAGRRREADRKTLEKGGKATGKVEAEAKAAAPRLAKRDTPGRGGAQDPDALARAKAGEPPNNEQKELGAAPEESLSDNEPGQSVRFAAGHGFVTLPYVRVTRRVSSTPRQADLADRGPADRGPADQVPAGGVAENERKMARSRRTAPGGNKAAPGPAGPSTSGPSGPAAPKASKKSPSKKPPQSPEAGSPKAGGPTSPGPGSAGPVDDRGRGGRRRAARDVLEAFVVEQLELGETPPIFYSGSTADPEPAGRTMSVIDGVRFDDITVPLMADLRSVVANDELSLGERFWLLEGPRAAVAATMQRIARLARAPDHEFGNGEIVMPGAVLTRPGLTGPGLARPGAGTGVQPAPKPAETERSESRQQGQATERMQIVLRLRTVR